MNFCLILIELAFSMCSVMGTFCQAPLFQRGHQKAWNRSLSVFLPEKHRIPISHRLAYCLHSRHLFLLTQDRFNRWMCPAEHTAIQRNLVIRHDSFTVYLPVCESVSVSVYVLFLFYSSVLQVSVCPAVLKLSVNYAVFAYC